MSQTANIELVRNSLEYYDNNMEKNQNFFEKIAYIKFIKKNKEMEHDQVEFYDEDENMFHSSRYEIIGLYVSGLGIWNWAWSVARFPKKRTYIAKKILDYGISLDYKSNRFLKEELVTGKFRISSQIQLEFHAAIASYLSKTPFVLPFISNKQKNREGGPLAVFDKYDDTYDVKISKNDLYYLFLLDPYVL